jgi:antitoxin HigA-1
MQRMHNPPHPGKILRDALGEIDVKTAAKKLHVSRTTLSRILKGTAGISADMSLRVSAALGAHESLWYELQMSYDISQASKKKQPKIEQFEVAV